MNGISIIVCCYNSAERLPETLKHLALQQVSDTIHWEVILVNNNSTDATAQIALEIWNSLGSKAPLVVVDEPKPGLAFAREKGIEQSKYDVLLWCDDDNWLCDIYVQTAFKIMEGNKQIGALGGWCEATFESEKPKWFKEYAKYFAISKQGSNSGDITNNKGCVYGAGMVTRKSHNFELKEQGFANLLKGRTEKSLSSGEDTEYCFALRLIGYKIWYDDRLYFKHFMTDGRLSLDYVSRLRKAMAYSDFILWAYRDVLKNETQSKQDFLKIALHWFPLVPIKKLVELILGNYVQKENSKGYFRNFRYRIFNYDTYKENVEFLKKWMDDSSVKKKQFERK